MEDEGPVHFAEVFEHAHEALNVVPVHGAVVVDVESRKERRLGAQEPDRLAFGELRNLPEARNRLHHALAHFARAVEGPRRDDFREVLRKRPGRGRNRAVVVIHDDEKPQTLLPDARVVEGFNRHAAREGAVADHGNRPAVVFAFKMSGNRHAERGGN